MLKEKVEKLTQNELCVIIGQRCCNVSSSNIARDLGVSRERVRQLKKRINDKFGRDIFLSGNKRMCKRNGCEVWFVPHQYNQRFCSDQCRNAHQQRQLKWVKIENLFIKLVSDIKCARPPFELKVKKE